ncbi:MULTISPECIES: hypothetical protein [Nocardia]|uniref:hypothetical protein n=1 Tax=Nocardia TaxID=1817 RepID=UPI000A804E16|nr:MULTISPECIES: hypothetical protein [Nocardia]MCC3316738.1 hypothetical protein [Nocardia africana]
MRESIAGARYERVDASSLSAEAGDCRLEPLSAFLRWSRDRGPSSSLASRARQPAIGPAKEFQEFEDYQNQLRRCLTEESLPLDSRVAGALIPYLFPGKPPTRPRHTRSLRQSLTDN